ncbi:MAG: fumarylacetoacetate hydrolase family protein [Bacteroidia bacterium]|nr:fumarylacetoacetate hydrolase family protein [Bacteroidia bacterium]
MKIICVGRNYAKHAKELKNEIPSEPVIFIKPDTALLPKKNPFFYPSFSKDVHYEVELVIKINKMGKKIQPQFAHKYYNEVSVGIDFTARDVQKQLKEKGLPWEKAKAFDSSAPVGSFVSLSKFKSIDNISFSLKLNGELKQEGNTSNMLFKVNELISYVSSFVTLKKGDLLFTGTPEGVGPVAINDHLEAFIEDEQLLSFNVK